MFIKAFVTGIAVVAGAAQVQAQTEFTGEVGLALRYFSDDGLYAGQSDSGLSAIIEGRIGLVSPNQSGRFELEAYGRFDDKGGTSLFDLPRAYYRHESDRYDVLFGSNIEYWGVSEGHNVVDIINQKDDRSPPHDRLSLGQPMINLNMNTGMNGTVSFYGLLGFRDRTFGDEDSRFRGPFITDNDRAFYEEGDGRHFDFAVRYADSVRLSDSSIDFAISYFNGTDRNPVTLLGCIDSEVIGEAACDAVNELSRAAYDAGLTLNDTDDFYDTLGELVDDEVAAGLSELPVVGNVPYYQHIQQFGAEFVWSKNDFQLTLEGAVRKASRDTSFAGVVGGQYNFDNVGNGSLIVIGEYLYDDRPNLRQPLVYFNNDVFVGFRYDSNSASGAAFKGGVYYDLDSSAQIYSLSYSQRLGDQMRLDLTGFLSDTDGYNDPLAFIGKDNYLQVSLARYF